jgi:mono/diheme cytochrome c family protein
MRTWRLAALCVLLAGCAGVQLPQAQLTAPGALLFNGYKNPDVNCYHCHNGDAQGSMRGPNLATRVPTMADAQIQSIIETGKSFMPSFKGKVSQAEIDDVIAWLRSSFPSAPDAGA